MTAELAPDPGPMARLEAVKVDPMTPDVVFQRLAAGESLKDIARDESWKLPVGPFTKWFTTTYPELFREAMEALAHQDAHEIVKIADAATPETVGPDKLKIVTRQWRASKYYRERYGEQVKIDRTITVTADAGLIGLAGELLERISRAPEKVVLPEPKRPDAEDAQLI